MVTSPQTDAARAGMTQSEWDALTDEQRAERRSAFKPVVTGTAPSAKARDLLPLSPPTDAERAGKTRAQWTALSEHERNELRTRYPDPNPHLVVAPVPSAPDPYNLARLGGSHPVMLERVEQQLDDDERLDYLPNTPGGRNHPGMANFDPTNPETA